MKATKQVKKLAREIFSVDSHIKHQGIIDLEGHVLLDQSAASSEPMEPDEDRIMFYYQVALRRTRRDYYNKTYGETTYVHIVRKKIQQLIIYLPTFTIYLTIDNKITPPVIAKIAEKIHSTDSDLLNEAITSTMYR